MSKSWRSCCCVVKKKDNWEIIGKAGKQSVVYCNKCKSQWNTDANYLKELKKR